MERGGRLVEQSSLGSTVAAPAPSGGIAGDMALFDTASGSSVNLDGASPSLAGISSAPTTTDRPRYDLTGFAGTLHLASGGAGLAATITVRRGPCDDRCPWPWTAISAVSATSAAGPLTISTTSAGRRGCLKPVQGPWCSAAPMPTAAGRRSQRTLDVASPAAIAGRRGVIGVGAGGVVIFSPVVGARADRCNSRHRSH